MSFIERHENKFIQRVGKREEELGKIEFDPASKTYVLWLKDTCGVLGLNSGYIRGEEYASLDEARKSAASSPASFILHWIWMRNAIAEQASAVVEDHWDEISPQVNGGISKESFHERVLQKIRNMSEGMLKIFGNEVAREAAKAVLKLFLDK